MEYKKRIETFRSGIFTFQIGIDFERIHPLMQRVRDASLRFDSVPMVNEIAMRLEKEVVVSSIYGTNTIEGGIQTEEEIEVIISSEVSNNEEAKRILNLKNAYNEAEKAARLFAVRSPQQSNQSVSLSEETITNLHAIITDGLTHPDNTPGRYRDNPKGQLTKVGDSAHGGVYVPPKCRADIVILMQHYLEWINSSELFTLDPLIRASLAHFYFETIHPFWDGNGRVGRVLEALILISSGVEYAPFALSRYYLKHIDRYFTVFNLARNSQIKKEPYPNTVFVEFVLEGMLEALNNLITRAHQIIGILIFQAILNRKLRTKEINFRQFTIIDNLLSRNIKPSLNSLKAELWYAELYRKLTAKTRLRDLKGLQQQGLIRITEDKIVELVLP